VVVSDLTGYHSLRFALYSRFRQPGKHENDTIERGVSERPAWKQPSASFKLGHTLRSRIPRSEEEEEKFRLVENALQIWGENHDLPAKQTKNFAEMLILCPITCKVPLVEARLLSNPFAAPSTISNVLA